MHISSSHPDLSIWVQRWFVRAKRSHRRAWWQAWSTRSWVRSNTLGCWWCRTTRYLRRINVFRRQMKFAGYSRIWCQTIWWLVSLARRWRFRCTRPWRCPFRICHKIMKLLYACYWKQFMDFGMLQLKETDINKATRFWYKDVYRGNTVPIQNSLKKHLTCTWVKQKDELISFNGWKKPRDIVNIINNNNKEWI
jgi:hypothetical protein